MVHLDYSLSCSISIAILIISCIITGFAGSDAKVEYLKSLGFDAAYNYKTISSLDETIKEACPNGVDMFFDNVRSKGTSTTLSFSHMIKRILPPILQGSPHFRGSTYMIKRVLPPILQ